MRSPVFVSTTFGTPKYRTIRPAVLAVSIDLYTNNTSALLQRTDYMLAKGSVAKCRPAIKGRLATSEDLASVSSIVAARGNWHWMPNIFRDPHLTNSGTTYSWATGAATPIVITNSQACIETPSSVGVKPPDGQVRCDELQKRKSLGLAGGPGEDRRLGHIRGSHKNSYPHSCLHNGSAACRLLIGALFRKSRGPFILKGT